MSDKQWKRAKQVFNEALEKSGPERDRFIAAACSGDRDVRTQVEALLAAHDEAGEFLDSPTLEKGGAAARAAQGVVAAGPPEAPGTRIGHYKLLQVIGEGGFGVVYMAEQEQPIRRRVALKIIKLGMDTKEVIARFEAERQALALMDHPNIAKVFDAGATESGRPYFVMELVKGVSITEYSDENQLSTRERLELFVDVCKALHHAHEKGIIHRDIKPSNVLVTLHDGTPVPKVIDFGIAKAMNQPLTEKTLFTAFGEFVGTPWCMSPEQAAMSGLEIDRRCDVYALGVLLYELLTGTTPFEAESVRSRTFYEIMRIIREEDPPTPSSRLDTLGKRLAEVATRRRAEPQALAKTVRGDLDWVVMKAMEKDRRRRYDSAVELADDLSRYFRHEPVIARKPSAAYRVQKFARRRRGPVLAAAAVVLAVVAGGAFGWIGRGDPVVGHGLPVIEPHLTRIIGSDTLQIHEPALSPDGRWVAFVTWDPASVWIVSADGGEPRRLVEGRHSAEPTWFPSGDRIAYFGWHHDSGGVWVVPFDARAGRATGSPQLVTIAPIVPGYRLSADGRWIAYRSPSDTMSIKVVPAHGGPERTIHVVDRPLLEPDGALWLMDWSADGRYIYFEHRRTARRYRIAFEGGLPEEIRQQPSGPSAPTIPYMLVRISHGPAQAFPLELQTYDGRGVARVALPQNAGTDRPGRGFTADGTRLLAVASGSATSLRLVSMAGEPPRQLGEARPGESPLGWSRDGRDVLFATHIGDRQAIMAVPVAGGAAREVGPMPDRGSAPGSEQAHPMTFSADGRYLAYSRPTPRRPERTLVLRPVTGGDDVVVTRALFHHSAMHLAGPGGTPNVSGPDFLYLERRGDQVDLRAIPPGGPSRLLRSFALADARQPKGVHGNRVAYSPGRGRLVVVGGPDGLEREVAAIPGAGTLEEIMWSPDGRWIAASAYVGSRTDYTVKVLVVEVTQEGEAASPARLLDTPIHVSAWDMQWLPDGSGVTLAGLVDQAGSRMHVWLVPVLGNEPQVTLTIGEPDWFSRTFLSPDGRHVLYGAYTGRGASLWLADLGNALKDLKR